jgi:hypothetical protein
VVRAKERANAQTIYPYDYLRLGGQIIKLRPPSRLAVFVSYRFKRKTEYFTARSLRISKSKLAGPGCGRAMLWHNRYGC